MAKVVLVVAAHPDDEVLGCGATMAKHVADGDEVHVVILAEGLTSREQKRNITDEQQLKLQELHKTARQANAALGVFSLNLHSLPDNRMDSLELLDVVKIIESYISQYRPDTVYTHHLGDVNIDHKITHQAVVTACRPFPGQPVKTLLFFEVASSTEWQVAKGDCPFVPNWFVDVSNTIELKKQALSFYSGEMREYPHPRSIIAVEHLARWRGASVGVEAAEAFILGRSLVQ